jgi:hypothetical protein
MRNYDLCYSNLKRYIIDPLNPDIFISTWNTQGLWKQLSQDEIVSKKVDIKSDGVDSSIKVNKEDIEDLYRPQYLNIINQHSVNFLTLRSIDIYNTYSAKFKDNWYYRIKNFISMYYQSLQVLEAVRQYQKNNNIVYDLVIRTRPDVRFNNYLQFLSSYDISKLYVCNNYAETNTLGDIFFAGNLNNNIAYHGLYNDIDNLLPIIDSFNPHHLVSTQLLYRNITYHTINLDVNLINSSNGYCNQGYVKR